MATVRIPPVLRSHTSGQRDVRIEGSTVDAVLTQLASEYPSLKDQLYENDQLRKFVNVYVNDEDIQYLQKQETPVGEQDVVIILPAMAGGVERE